VRGDGTTWGVCVHGSVRGLAWLEAFLFLECYVAVRVLMVCACVCCCVCSSRPAGHDVMPRGSRPMLERSARPILYESDSNSHFLVLGAG